jgi:MCP family monocarboxylic acid transporter-like MFS transporter 10
MVTMTTDEDAGSFVSQGTIVASSIRMIDDTSMRDSITPTSRIQRQADPDNSDSGEGKPLLTDNVAVTIDVPIDKLEKTHKLENTVTMDGTYRKRSVDEDPANETMITAIVPPDGGLRAWMIMIASFTINGVLFGIINTYSLIYPELQKRLTEIGETEVSSKAGAKFALA